ncbi:MAG TPA: hypothetical protein VKY74_15390 [Chloroflexia bacterium]|nr:hypothetical protein [Chloroflexia bacterium]
MAVNIGDIVSRGFQSTLRQRVLWVLGFLAALLATAISFRYPGAPSTAVYGRPLSGAEQGGSGPG